jgi:hypothetical protein
MRILLIAALFATTMLVPAHAREPGLTSMELNDFVGQYELADGRVLTVTQRARRLVAQVEGQEAVPLKRAGPGRFSAADGQLRVAFDQHANGSVTGVVIDVPAPPARQASR